MTQQETELAIRDISDRLSKIEKHIEDRKYIRQLTNGICVDSRNIDVDATLRNWADTSRRNHK